MKTESNQIHTNAVVNRFSGVSEADPKASRNPLIGTLLPQGALGSINGDYNAEKRHLVFQMMMAVATGTSVLSQESEHGYSIFLSNDVDKYEAAIYLKSVLDHLSQEEKEKLSGSMGILGPELNPEPFFKQDSTGCAVATKSFDGFRELCLDTPTLKLVVIDSFDFFVPAIEYSEQMMQGVKAALEALTEETGATILILDEPSEAREKTPALNDLDWQATLTKFDEQAWNLRVQQTQNDSIENKTLIRQQDRSFQTLTH
jgi:hypothetical protein